MHDFALQYKIFSQFLQFVQKAMLQYALLQLHKVSVWLILYTTFYDKMLYELIDLSLFDTQIKEKG